MAVVDEPLNATVGLLHGISSSGPAFALGAVVLSATTALADAVHPFAGSVTVTVYVPAVETALVVVVGPLLHAKVAPVVVELIVKVIEFTTQVNVPPAPIFVFGGVMVDVTLAVAVAVHVLASVTVRV